MIRPLPDYVSYDEASTLDCFTVGVRAVHRADITVADTVAVIGDAFDAALNKAEFGALKVLITY